MIFLNMKCRRPQPLEYTKVARKQEFEENKRPERKMKERSITEDQFKNVYI